MNLKEAIAKIKGSQDGKALVNNFAYLFLLQIAGYVFPLLTLPYLARVIGVEGFGKIAFASVVIVWIQTVADWGFNFTATRDVAKNRDNTEKVSEIFSNVLWARCLLVVISFVLLLLLIILIPKFKENQAIILVTFLLVPGHIMFPDWFFQAMERMKYITILNLLSKTLFTIAVFVFIKEKSDYILQPLFTSLGYVVSGVIAMYYILIKWKVKLHKPNVKAILQTIKGSTDVFLNTLVPNLYNSFSVLLLGFFGGTVSNGIFDAGNKFVGLSQQFMNIVSRTFFPFLSRRIDKHDLYVKLNLVLSVAFSFSLFLLAPLLIKLFFTEEFYDSVIVLRILSISVFLISIRNVYGTHYMLVRGYEKQLRNLTLLGSIVGFVFSVPLVYKLDFIGASINIIVAQSVMAITVVYKALQIKKQVKIAENHETTCNR